MPDGGTMRMATADRPRVVWVGNRRTSLRLEPEFWSALEEIAARRGLGLSTVLHEIERRHGRKRFSSRVRIEALRAFREDTNG